MSNLNSTSKLTEFPPLEAEEKADGRFSLSKFMFWRKSDGETSAAAAAQATQVSNPNSGPSSVPSQPIPAGVTISESSGVARRAESLENVALSISTSIPVRKRVSSNTPAYYRSDSNLSNPSPDPSMDGTASPFAFEARTLPNVLRRISNLIAMGSNNQADMKKYWMPDSVSKECYECGERFTTFRRKHHCRICGQIFCSRCCNQEIPGKIIGYSGDLRVCIYCCKIVLSYLQSADLNSDLTDDLRVVQEDLQNRFGASTPDSSLGHHGSTGQLGFSSEYAYRSLPRRKASVGYQEERFATSKSVDISEPSSLNSNEDKVKPITDWVGLKAVWEEMCNPVSGIDWATHRHNMIKNYHSCVVGSELVDWLLAQRKITLRGQGVQIGQMLIDSGLLECVSQAEQVFMDAYALYRPSQLPLPSVHEVPEPSSSRSSADLSDAQAQRKWSDTVQDPLWVKQIKNPHQTKNDFTDSKEMVTSDSDERAAKNRLPSSSSMYSVDLNLKNSTVSMSRPNKDGLDLYDNHPITGSKSPSASTKTTPRPQRKSTTMSITTEAMTDEFLQKTLLAQKERSKDSMSTPTGWHSPQELTNDNELAAFQRLCNAYIKHENDFLIQLLESMDLSSSWIDVILPIVHKVTEIVRPDVKHSDDDMDIRQYIQFKKVPGGAKEDCRIVNGVVCTKNISHRNMRHKIKDPRILLVGSSIDYQRFENRFLSLEPLVMQENDYLRNAVARICALNPDLVIVEKTVARLAQDFLLDHGITLVINVKPSVMERIARCTQGVVCDSVDTHIGRPQLGLCHNFYLETFKISDGMRKTLMFFDGCAMHLGCTVLLRGGTTTELMKVKKIISLMMFVAYNWRLERSFHIDSFAMPPLSKDDISTPLNQSPGSDEFVEAREELSPLMTSPSRTETTESLSVDSGVLVASFKPDQAEIESRLTCRRLKECLTNVILSASPFISYPLPYLETEEGKSCDLRRFFPMEAYWSTRLGLSGEKRLGTTTIGNHPPLATENENNLINVYMHGVFINSKIFMDSPAFERNGAHSLTFKKLTSPLGSEEVQSLIADFRRVGGRLKFVPQGDSQLTNSQKLRSNNSSWNTLESDKLRSGAESGRVDCLDPFLHQKLAVSFCSYSPMSTNFPYFCVNPWTVNMDMYGRNDISLGMFLERYCFRKTYLCPAKNCDTPMLQHYRRFVHQDACIQVILKELESPILGSGDHILMWSWCSICKTVSPIVPMSVDAWFLSFAKYLELRFHGKQYSRRAFDHQCLHSLHHEHQHYFAQHNIVAAFKYSKVKLWEVSLPPFFIRTKHIPKTVQQLVEDVKSVAILGYGIHGNIIEVLCSLKEGASGLKVEDVLNGLLELLKSEKGVFKSKIEDIQVSLTSPSLQGDKNKDSDAFLWKVTDAIGVLKCSIAETIQSWNAKLNEFLQLRKKEEKQAKGSNKNDSEQQTESKQQLPRIESESAFPPKELEDSLRSTNNLLLDSDAVAESKKEIDSLSAGNLSTSGLIDEFGAPGNYLNPDDSQSRNDRAPSPSPSAVRHSTDIERLKTDADTSRTSDSLSASDEVVDSGKPIPEKRISSSTVKTLISNLLSGASSVQLIQSPWPSTEHNFPAHLGSLPITVYEGEPSSVVAFTLSSVEYKKQLKEKRKLRLGSSSVNQDESNSSTGSPKDTFMDKMDSPKDAFDDKNISADEKDGTRDSDGHIEVQFRSSAGKFYCRVYFADNFRQLREMCLVEGEDFFIRSISRCVSWLASGGKSGSTFCKTVDDRFIVKQMSRFEIQSFLDFAPHYFDYMTTAFQEKRPTVLAKIVGVFRIGFKNSITTSASKMDILIMENLFYGRSISQTFDLKGSIRNRLATATGKEQEDLVLLDENLLNMACENPLYIRPHTKTVLLTALTNDSRFLGTQMVMDYSLLVGFDDEKRELVVGVIDYIRTFTWDKKIETFVKSSGILGGQGKTPTVVSPDEYQTRFCEAMDRYFLLVPDRWMGLGLGVDS